MKHTFHPTDLCKNTESQDNSRSPMSPNPNTEPDNRIWIQDHSNSEVEDSSDLNERSLELYDSSYVYESSKATGWNQMEGDKD